MEPTTLPTFSPPPDTIGQIVRAIADPHESLASIAEKFNTTLDALTDWILLPEITDRINKFQQVCAIKTRAVAANYTQHIATMCFSIIEEFNHGPDHVAFNPSEPSAHETKRRNRETARKAGALLLRLTRYFPATHAPTPRTPAAASRADRRDRPMSSDTPRASSTPDATDQLLDNPTQLTNLATTLTQSLTAPASPTTPAPNPTNTPAPATYEPLVLSDPSDLFPAAPDPVEHSTTIPLSNTHPPLTTPLHPRAPPTP